jgi:hypothetical protein
MAAALPMSPAAPVMSTVFGVDFCVFMWRGSWLFRVSVLCQWRFVKR